jgi:hypothetical protein
MKTRRALTAPPGGLLIAGILPAGDRPSQPTRATPRLPSAALERRHDRAARLADVTIWVSCKSRRPHC